MAGGESSRRARVTLLLVSWMLLLAAVVVADGGGAQAKADDEPKWGNDGFHEILDAQATLPPLTFPGLQGKEVRELDGMLLDYEYFDDQRTPSDETVTSISLTEEADDVEESLGITSTVSSLNDAGTEQDVNGTSASKIPLSVDEVNKVNSVSERDSSNVNQGQLGNTSQSETENSFVNDEEGESYLGFSETEDPLMSNEAEVQNDEAMLDEPQQGEAHWNTDLHSKINNIFDEIDSTLLLDDDKSLSSTDTIEKPIGTLPTLIFDMDDTTEKNSEEVGDEDGIIHTQSKEIDFSESRVQDSFEDKTTPVSDISITEILTFDNFSSSVTTEKVSERKQNPIDHETWPLKETVYENSPQNKSKEMHMEELKKNPKLEGREEYNSNATRDEYSINKDNTTGFSEGFTKSYSEEDTSEKNYIKDRVEENTTKNPEDNIDDRETSDTLPEDIRVSSEEPDKGTVLGDAPASTSELHRLGYRFGLPAEDHPKAMEEAEALLTAAGEGVLGDEAAAVDEDTVPAATQQQQHSATDEGVSLAFVFDYTGSMHDDLMAVMTGTQAILKTMMEDENKPIHNYVMVPFHDPKVGPLTVTTNHTLFNNSIKAISVHGGGDCPENALGGIKMALEASLPRSFIYVFTDASAKDVDLLKEVVPLIQRKKSQVVFVLTGDCDDTQNIRYLVYEKIADVSSGQVFHLNKSDVDEVLKFVKLSLQTRRVNLLSVTKPGPSQEEHSLLVDGSLDDFTVAVAGSNAEIDVKDPAGRVVEKPQLQPVLDLSNVKVVKVENPDPGRWTVKTSSTSQHSVRSTGTSLMDFQFGFSVAPVANLHQTFHRPLKGTPNHILIKATASEGLHNLTNVRLVNLNGTTVHEVELFPIEPDDLNGPYSGDPFLPPNDMFFVEVMGIGTDGFPLKRMTHTAISAQKPAVPIVTMKPRLAIPVGQNGTITCYVESLVPFTILWLKDGELIRERTSYKQTSDVFLQLTNMTEVLEGSYTCHASNEEGSTSKQTKLRITGPPPIIVTKEKIVTAPGENVEITCDVESVLKYSTSWFRFSGEKQNSKKREPWPLQIDSHININNLNKLLITNVKPEDEGWYACVVQNRGGKKEGTTYLHVRDPVHVVLYPTAVAFQRGDDISISCRASGSPEPKLQWRKNGIIIEEEVEDGHILVTKDASQIHLFIEDADDADKGHYECYAENIFDSDIGGTIVEYQEPPSVIASWSQLNVPVGGSLVMQCDKTGIPVPTLKWYKNDEELISNDRYILQDDILKIIHVSENDSGDYICEAVNVLGTSIDTVHVDIGNSPQIIQPPRDLSVDLNKNISLRCLVSGFPIPIISWGRKFQQDLPEGRYLISTAGTLHIFDAHIEDAGTYICSAENKFGSVEASANIKITGIEKPVLDRSDNQGREIEMPLGATLELPCRILMGNPPPKHIWYKDGTEIDKLMMLEDGIILHDNGSLLVTYITHKHAGTYECVLTNAGGSVSKETFLRVTEAPQFLTKASPEKHALVGEDVQLDCDVRGEPKPLIMWEKDGLLLSPSRRIIVDDDDSLIIRVAISSDKGIYTCVATNSAGTSRRSTFLFMQSPPKISSGPQDLHAIEGQLLTLKCDVSAEPVAVFTWWKNDKPLNNTIHNIQYLHQNSSIRFVATLYSQGKYTCVASNPAGKDSRDFEVSVMVPPNIYPPYEEQIAAMLGEKVTLDCQVFGSPPPKIFWNKDGTYLNENNTDIKIGDDGTLTITNITGESGGIYICDAENDVGVSQKLFYFSVNVPPKILELLTNKVQLMEGEDFFLPCSASGFPLPEIRWHKDGRDIQSLGLDDMTVYSDGTLLLLAVNQEHSGLYTCIAENKYGSEHRNYLIDVLVPPSMIQAESSDLEVKEGESLVIACPAMDAIPAPQIDWIKDGHHLDLPSTRVVLEDGGRALKILAARLSDRGTYWCVATNPAGQSSASFNVDVMTAPFFSDNSLEESQPRHHLVTVGKPVTFRCSVQGHPTPRVSWKKNNHPITVNTAPGVVLSGDKQILHIPSVQQHDTGHYQCSVVNKAGSFYRDFELSVIKPPGMIGPMEKYYTIISGSDILLQCPFTGLPEPLVTWTKNGMNSFILEMNNALISPDQKQLQITSIKPSDSGIFSCEANNLAGHDERSFNISVLEAPSILQANILEEISVPEGGSVSLECWIEGVPYPHIIWMHNGHILPVQNDLISNHFNEEKVLLHLRNLESSHAGRYTCFASNEAGVKEKSFHVHVMVAPKMMNQKDNSVNDTDKHSTVHHEKIKGMPIILHCPVDGKPLPEVHWIKDSQRLEPSIVGSEPTLYITNSTLKDSGNYTCLAYNKAGIASKTFQVIILDPPTINAIDKYVQIKAGDKLTLDCEVEGFPTPEIMWLKGASSITPELWPKASFLHNNTTLVLPDMKVKNSGHYSCLAINKIGTAEHNFIVQVLEAPYVLEAATNTTHKVKKNRRLVLKCFFEGSPLPKISWFKGDKLLNGLSAIDNIHISSDNRQLHILNTKLEDSGIYKCKAENEVGSKVLSFVVDVQTTAHWTNWGPWSECSVSCGPGEQIRQRTCGEPKLEDQLAQIECPGLAEEWQNCNMAECQVNGGWNEWSSWTSCSVSCGRGTRRRYRKCNNPVPMYGGALCQGSDAQQEYCHQMPCPIDGKWSEWTPWTDCSVTCDNGVQHRTRQCNNPPPMYGGTNCSGKALEVINCNSHECPQDGEWSTWSKWSPCSTSCGPGNRQRSRECNNPAPKYGGNECKGENLQISHCTARSCDNIPLAAALHVRGKLNGEKLADSLIAANITDEGHKRTVQASTNDILKHQAGWFPYLTFMLSPISWSTAREEDEANNGYSLTQGRFKQDSVVEFGSGEGLQLRHIGHGIDDTGVLRVDIEVHGQVPIIEEDAQVVITPFEEDYVQTSPNSLFASAASTLKVNGVKLPYSWNNTVFYDSEGTMPYLVEKLSAQEVGVKYNPKKQEITSIMSTAIGRKYSRDTCPDGFVLDSQNMHCRDINECSDKRVNRCHVTQICENLFGTYRCSCEKGFRSSAIGKRCVDINECLQSPPICSHRCRNTRGSFKCQCPPGYTLLNDGRTCSETQYWDYPDENAEINYAKPIPRSAKGRRPSKFLPWTEAKEMHTCPPGFENLNGICSDKNECKTGNLCSQNETCLNTKGSFRCLETPCPDNYMRNIETGFCQVYCDMYACETGALLTQTISYMVITPDDEAVHPYQDLVQLSVRGDNGQQLAHTRYRITENETGKPFRVRFEKGQGVLYSLKFLPAGRIYRVTVLALSYDESEINILYTTKFIIFIYLPDD